MRQLPELQRNILGIRIEHPSTQPMIALGGKYGDLDLFNGVDMPSIAELLDASEEIEIPKGHIVLEEGAFNDALYLLLEGELDVRLGGINAATLLTLGIGGCVGELSILSQLNVSAYVVAVARLLDIRGSQLWSITGTSHELSRNLLKVLSGRVGDNNN
jgi:CRP-like cAMP-binding protein